MGREGEDESDTKYQLVKEICNISNRAIACAHLHHHHHHHNPNHKSPFIDWYLLLKVKEDAGIDKIRKQYHKLALQLHPDKNNHPKAEVAFKLVSEAYACLSDNDRRTAFSLDRHRSFCRKCNTNPHKTCNSPISNGFAKFKSLFPSEILKSSKTMRSMSGIGARFKEEARVIENCLKANAALRRESPVHSAIGKELPVFCPSDYLSNGYPHYRSRNHKNLRTQIPNNTESFWSLHSGKRCEQGRGKCDSPIFELGSGRRSFKFKSACMSS